ncbi:MAG: hypothetical protein IE916_00445 [Epsilonproteobacteria bacterium]|nr:hypothetical protein [Campylobacterota bacterium]
MLFALIKDTQIPSFLEGKVGLISPQGNMVTELTPGALTLISTENSMSKNTIKKLEGKLNITFFTKKGIPFLIFDFNGSTISSPVVKFSQKLESNALFILGIDTETKILKVQRMIGLPMAMIQDINRVINSVPEEKLVDNIYAVFDSVSDRQMIKKGKTYTVGMPEENYR